MEDNNEYKEAMTMLFTARWNIPRAARLIKVSDEECKEIFRKFCLSHPPTFVAEVPDDPADSGQTV